MQAKAQYASLETPTLRGSSDAQPSSDRAASEELEESDDEYSSAEESTGLPPPSENRSFASTYWRPERHDRKGDLSVIDERYIAISSKTVLILNCCLSCVN